MEPASDDTRSKALVSTAQAALADAPPQEIIAWAAETFGDRMCVYSPSTDALIIHLAATVKPGIDVLFLDTGYHFQKTIETRDKIAAAYDINLINVRPSKTVAEQDASLGPQLYRRIPDLCCFHRKERPLECALDLYEAWITDERNGGFGTRTDAKEVEWDSKRKMVKVNPIVRWSQERVDAYTAQHGLVLNPLIYEGYHSVGCAPCTFPVKHGADQRSGPAG